MDRDIDIHQTIQHFTLNLINMKRGINANSRAAMHQVLSYIYSNKITKIHTRGALDRMIEIAKFPETRSFKSWAGRSLVSGKVTAYKNQQYDPIRETLIKRGYLKQEHDGYRYHYTVVKK
jgi:hypothetical protein